MGMQGTGGEQSNVKTVGTVDWDPTDRARIKQEFFFPTTPSSARVWQAQEGLLGLYGLIEHHQENQRRCQHAFGRNG